MRKIKCKLTVKQKVLQPSRIACKIIFKKQDIKLFLRVLFRLLSNLRQKLFFQTFQFLSNLYIYIYIHIEIEKHTDRQTDRQGTNVKKYAKQKK